MSKGKVNFTVNNDELEKIAKRLYELKVLSDKNLSKMTTLERIEHGENKLCLSAEELIEYSALNRLNMILFNGNNIFNPTEYILVDGMRVASKDIDKFYEYGQQINVPGLTISRPPYLGDVIPGTKKKMPRVAKKGESIPEYELYLEKFYKKLHYEFGPVEYYENTEVPKPRAPYPHERYVATENGYKEDSGKNHPYYKRMCTYYKKLAAAEYAKMEEQKKRKEVTESLLRRMAVHTDTNPAKVVNIENIPGASDTIKQTIEEYAEQFSQAQYTAVTEPNNKPLLGTIKDVILGIPQSNFVPNEGDIADINNLQFAAGTGELPKDIRIVKENPLAGDFVEKVSERVSEGLLPVGVGGNSIVLQDTTMAVESSEAVDTIYEKIPKEVLVSMGITNGLAKDVDEDTLLYINSLINKISQQLNKYPGYKDTLEGCIRFLEYCIRIFVMDANKNKQPKVDPELVETDVLLSYADEILPLYGIAYGNRKML